MNNVKYIYALLIYIYAGLNLHFCGDIETANNAGINPANKIPYREVLTHEGADSVLGQFVQCKYEDLPVSYIEFAGYNNWAKSREMKGKTFYMLNESDTSCLLAGKYSAGMFLARDSLKYFDDITGKEVFYLCLSKEVLYLFIDLINMLRQEGYSDNFIINDGFRYPSFNIRTGGALYSRHQFGEAIDIAVGDIDNDGTYLENKDKKIVADMLDKKIVKDKGGVGFYPGLNVLHFDVRGYRARWNGQ